MEMLLINHYYYLLFINYYYWKNVSKNKLNIPKLPRNMKTGQEHICRSSRLACLFKLEIIWMNSKIINRFSFRMIWKIMQINEIDFFPPYPSGSVEKTFRSCIIVRIELSLIHIIANYLMTQVSGSLFLSWV